MKFSVLMSLYYKEKAEYLTQCFASLAVQTVPASEIVLVFDGQIPQQLQDCVTEWQQKLPLKIVPLPQNVGLGKALNAGLAECSNEWVFRMDTDDLCVQDRFAKQIAYIEAHPEVSMVGDKLKNLMMPIRVLLQFAECRLKMRISKKWRRCAARSTIWHWHIKSQQFKQWAVISITFF